MSDDFSKTDAQVQLILMSEQASEEDREAFYIKILNSDLPMEVVTRLSALWATTLRQLKFLPLTLSLKMLFISGR